MITSDTYKLNDAVRKKLLRQVATPDTDEPFDEYAKASIDSGMMRGIAGGLAQLGTVHGKTPDVTPYVQSSQAMLQPLRESAANIQKSSQLDPRVLDYLTKNRAKENMGKLLPQRNDQGYYLQQQPTGEIQVSPFKGYNPPREPRSEGSSLPIDKKKIVEKLATDIASYKSSRGLLEGGIQQYNAALDRYKKTGSKADSDDVVRNGQALLKILNSPLGSDAVGSEEVQRIGNALKFQYANINNPGAFWGFDFEGFKRQLNSARDKVKYAEDQLQSQIDSEMKRSNTPGQPTPPPTQRRTLTPEELKELQEYEALEAQGGD